MTKESCAKRKIKLIEFLLVNLFLITLMFAFVCSVTITILFLTDTLHSVPFCLAVAMAATFIIYPKKYSYTMYNLVYSCK